MFSKPTAFRVFASVFALLILVILCYPSISAADKIDCPTLLKSPPSAAAEARYTRGYCHVKTGNHLEGYYYLNGLGAELPLIADYINYYAGLSLMKRKKWHAAAEKFYAVLQNSPPKTLKNESLLKISEAYFADNDFERAAKGFKLVHEKDNRRWVRALALNKAAVSLESLGRHGEAVLTYKKLWLNYPESSYSSDALAKARKIAKSNKIPIKVVNSEIIQRADRLYKLGLWKSAHTEYRKGVKTTTVKLRMGKCELYMRKYDNASRTLSALYSAEAKWWLARTKLKLRKESEAIYIYSQIHRTHPESGYGPKGLYMAGRLRQIDGKYEEAAKRYKTLIKSYPKHEKSDQALWELGWMQYKLENYDAALAYFSKTSSSQAMYWRAKTYEKMYRISDALAVYKKLANRSEPSYYSYLAHVKTGIKNGNYKSATNRADKSSNPIDGVRKERVDLLMKLGMYDDARAELAALKDEVRSKSHYLELSLLFAQLDDYYSSILYAGYAGSSNNFNLTYPKGMESIVAYFADKYGVDEHHVYSIMREESRFQTEVVSPAGAIGLMQIMPATGRKTAKMEGIGRYKTDLLYKPLFNINLGVAYFKSLLDEFDGNVIHALAGYNGGPHNVVKWIARYGELEDDEFVEEIPYKETRYYVKRVLRSYGVYKALYSDGTKAQKKTRLYKRTTRAH